MSTDLEEIRRTALHLTICVNALVDDDLVLASKHSKALWSSKSPLHAAVIGRVLLKEKKLESARRKKRMNKLAYKHTKQAQNEWLTKKSSFIQQRSSYHIIKKILYQDLLYRLI